MIQLFNVSLDEETGKFILKFSNEVKSSIPLDKIEELLNDDVNAHLKPIVYKIVNAL